MQIRTDRVGLLVEQLQESMHFSRLRMEGLSDAEYLWEPVPGMWSIRQRGASTMADPWGLDPELPFIGIVRWVNREFIHHLAEAAVLRDLYAATAGGDEPSRHAPA